MSDLASLPPAASKTPPPWLRRRVEWLCTIMGAWGVATGLAVFILLWTHGRLHPWAFVIGLLVAAIIAYVAELLRDLIREGVAVPAITGPRVVVTVLLLMIIELVVHAGTALVQLSGHDHSAVAAKSELQGLVATIARQGSGIVTELIALALAWMVVGAVVARRLSRIVFLKALSLRGAILAGAREGALGGLVAAPLCALACLLALRWFGTVQAMILGGETWARELRFSLTHTALDSNAVALLKLPGWLWLGGWHLGRAWHGVGAVLLVAVLVGGAWWAWRRRASPWTGRLLLLALVLLVLAPLTDELDRFGRTALLAMLIWIVPGTMLGIAAPLLRGAGDEPRLWGLIAFGAAALLALLTLLKFTHPWCYALAVALVLIGVLFFRGAPLREYWPLAAAAMASMVSGVMVLVERATFVGVFSEVHAVHQLPSVRPDPLLRNVSVLLDLVRPDEALDDDEMRALAREVRLIARLPVDRQVAQFGKIGELLERLQTRLRREEAEHLRGLARGSLWGVANPGDDVAALYTALADLVETPPAAAGRETAYGALLTRADALIAPEREKAARLARAQEREEALKAEQEAELRAGGASDDTVRFGPELGALAAELFAFSQLPAPARDARGVELRLKLEAMLNAEGIAPGPAPQLPGFRAATRGTSFESASTRRALRLIELHGRLAREIAQPGAGGFAAPQPFAGDADTLPWRRKPLLSSTLPGGSPLPQLTGRLDWLERTRAEIERQRAALAAEQEPQPRPAQPAADPIATASAAAMPAVTPESRLALSIAFPAAARKARLTQIRDQLLVVRRAAADLKEGWTAPSAVMLELSIVGSFGFWVTVALLAAWSLTEPRKAGHD